MNKAGLHPGRDRDTASSFARAGKRTRPSPPFVGADGSGTRREMVGDEAVACGCRQDVSQAFR